MNLAKLEPFVIEPVMDGRDINSFVNEVSRDGNDRITSISTQLAASDPPIQKAHEEVKSGFIRLNDFIMQREKQRSSGHQTKRLLMLSAYRAQRDAFTRDQHLGTNFKRAL